MKTIKIKKMKLLNFKGIRELEINFSDSTNIFGANAAGKTTIADAFSWLLFGKDTTGRSDFNVKTLDSENNEIPEIEHSVEVEVEIDGQISVITKNMKDNWVKRRGSTESEFKGNTTEYYVNNVPKKQKEFQEFVAEIVNEDVFRMITNPLHFNTMPWKERRDIVLKMVEQPTNETILAASPDVGPIIEELKTKSTDDLKAEYAAQKAKLSKDLVDLPGRIDEAKRSLFENPTLDEELIKSKKCSKLTLEERLSNSVQILEEVKQKQNRLYILTQEEQNNRTTFNKEQNELSNAFNSEQEKEPQRIMQQIESIKNEINFKKTLIVDVLQMQNQFEQIQKDLEDLTEEYKTALQESFILNENETVCPTCLRKLENVQDIITQLEQAFAISKDARMNEINNQGLTKKQQLDSLQEKLNDAANTNNTINKEISELESELQKLNAEHTALILEKKVFKAQEYKTDEATELEIKKLTSELENVNSWNEAQKAIQGKLDVLNRDIDREYMRVENELKHNAQTNHRIEELMKSERDKNVAIAKVEQLQDLLTTYIITRVNLIETEVNSKFELANFKMFDEQINGGIKETCEVTVNGVPYSDLNNAMKVNVGLDVIGALSNHFEVIAPIFIDNRESVTQIMKTNAQVINLVVSKNDKDLRVEGVNSNESTSK